MYLHCLLECSFAYTLSSGITGETTLRILSPCSESDGSRWNINCESLEGRKKPENRPPPSCRWIVCVSTAYLKPVQWTPLCCTAFALVFSPFLASLTQIKKKGKGKKKSSFLHYINIGKLLLLSFSLSCWAYWANWSEFVSFSLQAWRGLFARDWLSGEQM